MTDNEFTAVISELDDLLDAEKKALLEGDLEKVGRLLERKEVLIEQLSVLEAAEVAQLENLNTKVKRNQVLLDHALQGIRSVAQRLAALRQVRNSLDTYDESGKRQTIDMNSESVVEKRA
ncbi:flagellar biosynthesis protein FlgN [uncultured Roseobacter sp.]|uniref:flagellar biosynthesis protein FlgN n=1 Tax=uncultured Roseobacter sp. TaxID=114847 RepID=UPI00260A48B2|nr:flagellar biosynthesis protein FlgN [uncultured Roseobacter sp.]